MSKVSWRHAGSACSSSVASSRPFHPLSLLLGDAKAYWCSRGGREAHSFERGQSHWQVDQRVCIFCRVGAWHVPTA
jgi:hypothetical protein